MDKELIQKVLTEHPLTAEEALRLDGALEGDAGKWIAHVVSSLPEESLSLTWRSELNERLAKVSRRRRRVVYWRLGFGAAAVAAASILTVMLVQPVQPTGAPRPGIVDTRPEESLEDAILAGHRDAMSQASLGVSVSFNEAGS